jgi:hypothetical protein
VVFGVGCGPGALASRSPAPNLGSASPALTLHAAPISTGDVFAGIGNGRWNHFDSDGTLLSTLDDGHIGNVGGFSPAHATSGMCFDPAGNMYAMNFSANSMSKFDNQGALLADSVGTFNANPESCLVAGGNTIYASEVTGTGDILKLDLAGTQLANYDVPRSDWIDLATDGCTMLYSDERLVIHRFDVCNNKAMTDLTSGGGAGRIYALRVLPDGTVLAAASSSVERFDMSGAAIASYTAPGEAGLFALNLDPDGAHFWTAGLSGNSIYKFNIESVGPPVKSFSPQIAAGGGTGLAAIAVFREPVASQAASVATPANAFPVMLLLLLALLVLLAVVALVVLRKRRRSRKAA